MISVQGRPRRQKPGLLHLSSKADYGFLLLIRLAGIKARRQSLRLIAAENGLSFFFLQKVALDLRKNMLITADRGKSGGYGLARPAKEISLKDIIEALDGPLAIMGCLGDKAYSCPKRNSCEVRPGLDIVNRTIINALSNTSLYDLTNSYGRSGNKRSSHKSRTN